jgi:hypothetical protein
MTLKNKGFLLKCLILLRFILFEHSISYVVISSLKTYFENVNGLMDFHTVLEPPVSYDDGPFPLIVVHVFGY